MKQDEAKIDKHSLSQIDAEQRAIKALEEVIEHGPKIELDHYILYSARKFYFFSLYFPFFHLLYAIFNIVFSFLWNMFRFN